MEVFPCVFVAFFQDLIEKFINFKKFQKFIFLLNTQFKKWCYYEINSKYSLEALLSISCEKKNFYHLLRLLVYQIQLSPHYL